MGYLLFTIFVVSIVAGTGIYLLRNKWLPYMPDKVQDMIHYTYSRIPTSTSFMGDVESGLHSSNFDLSENLMEGDSRSGLDQKGKQAVQRIMRSRGISFDEARAMYMQQNFKKSGIGADGLPNDPKLVTFGGR